MASYDEKNQKSGPTPFGQRDPANGGLSALADLVRSGQAHSRADLVRITGMSRSSISDRVESLISIGLLAELGLAESTGGRRAAFLVIPSESGVVLAVDFGAIHCRWAIAHFTGEIIFEVETEVDISQDAEVVLGWLAKHAATQLNKLNLSVSDVKGVGIGLPGPVEFATGRVISPPIMPRWHDVSVPSILLKYFESAVVVVDNDVNMMAIGEYVNSWEKETSNLLFIKHSTGIGAGVIVGGRILHGELGAAGDLGHVAINSKVEYQCTCGNINCIESVCGGIAIVKQLQDAGLNVNSVREVADAALVDSMLVATLLREAGRLLGSVLSTVVNILNPGVIVIGGSIATVGDGLIAGVREIVYSRSTSLATKDLKIIPSTLGSRSGVIGCLRSILDELFSEPHIASVLQEAAVTKKRQNITTTTVERNSDAQVRL